MSASPSISSSSSRTITLITRTDDVEDRIQKHKKDKDLIAKNQENYFTTTQNRSSYARTTSRACCCCSGIAYVIHWILCLPTRLCCQNSWYNAIRECVGCGLNRPPENQRELCCRYCTPPCDSFPEETDHFSTSEEREEEKQRFESMQLLDKEINQLQTKISHSRRSSSCLDTPDHIYTRPPTPEEESNLTNYIIEVLPFFPEENDEDLNNYPNG